MPSGNSWTNLFGASPVAPANPSYEALTLAANTALVWPLETVGGNPYVATQIDVTATTAGLSLAMPPGNVGSNGAGALITNVGVDTFTVTDTAGNQIVQIATTQMWLVTLTDNATVNGSWRAYQLAATVSQATAAQLAGDGLEAFGSRLRTLWTSTYLASDTAITTAYRAKLIVWNGVSGTLSFNPIATLGVGWYCAINNQGSGSVTLAVNGADTINGLASLTIHPGDSGIIIATATVSTTAFITVGALIDVLNIESGGTGADNANQALVNLGGTSIGVAIFTAPDAAAIVALLGVIGGFLPLTGGTINGNLTVQDAGVFTNSQMNLHAQFLLNGAVPQTEFQWSHPGQFATEGLTAAVKVPSTATVYQVNASAVYIANDSTIAAGAVGQVIYGRNTRAGATTYAQNILVTDQTNIGLGGVASTVLGGEDDIGAFNLATVAIGRNVIGVFPNGTPATAIAWQISVLNAPWQIGYHTTNGSALVAFNAGALANTANSNSQPINFVIKDSGNVERLVGISALSNGSGADLSIVTPTGGVILDGPLSVFGVTNIDTNLMVGNILHVVGATLIDSSINMAPIAAPVTPAAGHVVLYVDIADGTLKAKGAAGTVTPLAVP